MNKSNADIRMLVKVELSPYAGRGSGWADDYFFVVGKPVKMVWENGESMPFGSFYTVEGDPYYEKLEVRAQGDIASGRVYGYSVEYHEPSRVTLYEAERMLKVLRPINRKMERMIEDLGHVGEGDATTFASYLARAGKAMGINQYGFLPLEGSKFANGYHYQWWSATMLDSMILERIKHLRSSKGVEVLS